MTRIGAAQVRTLFLGSVAAFAAALLVGHLLGPLTLWVAGGVPPSPLWDPFLIGVSLAVVAAPLAWLMARGFELTPGAAGFGVGVFGTLLIWTPGIVAHGLGALFEADGAFPLRLVLAVVASGVAAAWARMGLTEEVRKRLENPYAAAMDASLPRVVILGGGFAGLSAARALEGAPVRVTLVDARNHHLFQPLLYQVATAALPPTAIATPLRRVLRRQANAEVLMARAVGVDLLERQVKFEDGVLAYDRLIVATGAVDNARQAWAPFAPGLKSLGDALEIRNRVLVAFEAAEREADEQQRQALLTFVVVGGGPTGVELAGALSDIARRSLDRDFRHIRAASAQVVLVEGGERLLPQFAEKLSEHATRSLQAMGVKLLAGTFVTGIDASGVTVKDAAPGSQSERRIESRTVIWAAGVKASPLGAGLGAPLDKTGRVEVLPDLTLPGHPEVSVVGDLAALTERGRPVPALAPAAMQEGRQAAKNIVRALQGKSTEAFRYRDKGSLATIGRFRAVGQLGKLHLSGALAWLIWVFVHIIYLIGFRNRYLVLSEWALAWLFHDRGARLISDASVPAPSPEPEPEPETT